MDTTQVDLKEGWKQFVGDGEVLPSTESNRPSIVSIANQIPLLTRNLNTLVWGQTAWQPFVGRVIKVIGNTAFLDTNVTLKRVDLASCTEKPCHEETGIFYPVAENLVVGVSGSAVKLWKGSDSEASFQLIHSEAYDAAPQLDIAVMAQDVVYWVERCQPASDSSTQNLFRARSYDIQQGIAGPAMALSTPHMLSVSNGLLWVDKQGVRLFLRSGDNLSSDPTGELLLANQPVREDTVALLGANAQWALVRIGPQALVIDHVNMTKIGVTDQNKGITFVSENEALCFGDSIITFYEFVHETVKHRGQWIISPPEHASRHWINQVCQVDDGCFVLVGYKKGEDDNEYFCLQRERLPHRARMINPNPPPPTGSIDSKKVYVVAAALFLLIGIGAYLLRRRPPAQPLPSPAPHPRPPLIKHNPIPEALLPKSR